MTLDDDTSVNPTFTAPKVQAQQVIVFELVVTNELGGESLPDSVTITVDPANIHPNPPPRPFDGILGSGNNINLQVQDNSGDSVLGGQSGALRGTYSDSPILQGQSLEQDSQAIS